MVGVDDNAYSDHALQWLLDELVDDGDEIVCVRVIETQVRLADKAYQEDAARLMESIQSKNTQNHAISLILEYAVGKLHSTFQHLVCPKSSPLFPFFPLLSSPCVDIRNDANSSVYYRSKCIRRRC